MTEDFKLKRIAKNIRRLILDLQELIDITEIPIELKVGIKEDHKNINKVWKEIGIIPLNH